MKLHMVFGIIFLISCLSGVPAAAQYCCHQAHHCGDSDDCDHHCFSMSHSSPSYGWKGAASEATEGNIVEVSTCQE